MWTFLTRESLLEATWQLYGEGRGCHRRQCLACGRMFFTRRPESCYCRTACRQRAYRQRVRARRATLAHGPRQCQRARGWPTGRRNGHGGQRGASRNASTAIHRYSKKDGSSDGHAEQSEGSTVFVS